MSDALTSVGAETGPERLVTGPGAVIAAYGRLGMTHVASLTTRYDWTTPPAP
jgi:hypothetical protein